MPRDKSDHYLFVAPRECVIPNGADSEIFIETARECGVLVQPYGDGIRRIIGMHFPVVPYIEQPNDQGDWVYHPGWLDGENRSNDVLRGGISHGGLPMSYDGITLRENRHSIVGVGLLKANGDFAVWSGIATFDPLGSADYVNPDMTMISIVDQTWAAHVHTVRYPGSTV